MARRTASEKAATHERILRHAARSFRKEGSAVGIGEVMKDLGLTHGGFYRHFASKDDLLVDAFSLALADVAERLEKAALKAPAGEQLRAIITTYLSVEHLAHPETWCALATLAPDMSRLPPSIRKRLESALVAYMERLLAFMPGRTEQERRGTFLVLISGMAGAIALIRVFAERETRERMLDIARGYYLKAFSA
jgi:TetR/AcrR family transcriptional repressor of nem operon